MNRQAREYAAMFLPSDVSLQHSRRSDERSGTGVSSTAGNAAWSRVAAAPRISVVMPTLNEARNLPHVFALMPADIHEVVLVDGNSTDDTVAVARALRPDVRVISQTRRGKGNALACGFAACTGDIIVMLDADGSTDPREIPAFVAALTAGADFAKGSRFRDRGGSADITPMRRAGNLGLNALVNALYRTSYTDLCYGYNAFWRHCLPVLQLDPGRPGEPLVARDALRWGDGFEIETIINTRAAKAGLRVTEVASYERLRLHGASNLNAVRDGLRVLGSILRERWGRRGPVRPVAPVRRTHPPVAAVPSITVVLARHFATAPRVLEAIPR